MRRISQLLALTVVAWCISIPVPSPAFGAEVVQREERLPRGLTSAPVASDGRFAYLFGGLQFEATEWGGTAVRTDEIVRYDMESASATVVGARLPEKTESATAVWADGYAYIFGGYGEATGISNKILRYDPFWDLLTPMTATLPSRLMRAGSIWTGRFVYIFGGYQESVGKDEIYRYDPLNDTVALVSQRLPYPLQSLATAFDGRYAYLIGGSTQRADILRFDTETETLVEALAYLPTPLTAAAAVWISPFVYVFGGYDGTNTSDAIVQFDPRTNTSVIRGERLPAGRTLPKAAVHSSSRSAFIMEGCCDPTETYYSSILQYVPDDYRSPSSLSLETSSNSVFVDDEVILNGTLGLSGDSSVTQTAQTVYIDQLHPDGTTHTVTATTQPDGAFAISFVPRSVGVYQLQARWSGNDDYLPSTSSPVTIQAARPTPWVDLRLSASSILLGDSLTITGVAMVGNKPLKDTAIRLTRSSGWQSESQELLTDASGSFSTADGPTERGENVYLAVLIPTPTVTAQKSVYVKGALTNLTLHSAESVKRGHVLTPEGNLTDSDGRALRGRKVSFAVSDSSVSAMTDSSGRAMADLRVMAEPGLQLLRAFFEGDRQFEPIEVDTYVRVEWEYTFVSDGQAATIHLNPSTEEFDFITNGYASGIRHAGVIAAAGSPAVSTVFYAYEAEDLSMTGTFDLWTGDFAAIVRTPERTFPLYRTSGNPDPI